MAWGNCGTESKGRPIGYLAYGECDYPGCEIPIDRGLGYACGDMHGENEYSCEGYFCARHLIYSPAKGCFLCPSCKESCDGER